MDRIGVANLLRARRERTMPADVGLHSDRARRTPGLRREEVADLAHISLEHYTHLEQARGARPSVQTLKAVADGLRFTPEESRHLFVLADAVPPPPASPPTDVPDSTIDLLDRLPLTAGLVLSASYDVLAWNQLAARLLEDFADDAKRTNFARQYFTPRPTTHGGLPATHYGLSDTDTFSRYVVAELQAAAARYPTDPGIRQLVSDLCRDSTEFAALWRGSVVAPTSHADKAMTHPIVGHLILRTDIYVVLDRDQNLVLLSAAPGSRSEDKLRALAAMNAP